MNPRAVIFDVYGTLFDLGPPPVQPSEAWRQLFEVTFRRPPAISLPEFSDACRRHVALHHKRARSLGIAHPEVVWPSIVREVLPELAALNQEAQDEFIFRQSQLMRTISLNPDAARLLPRMRTGGVLLGIASNAQAYTLREMREPFAAAGLNWVEWFQPSLCFWSFEHGFSKPDPHVFQILTSRLGALGIGPEETLMVGDRLDNDIEPARAFGWSAWWLHSNPGACPGGTWRELSHALHFST